MKYLIVFDGTSHHVIVKEDLEYWKETFGITEDEDYLVEESNDWDEAWKRADDLNNEANWE